MKFKTYALIATIAATVSMVSTSANAKFRSSPMRISAPAVKYSPPAPKPVTINKAPKQVKQVKPGKTVTSTSGSSTNKNAVYGATGLASGLMLGNALASSRIEQIEQEQLMEAESASKSSQTTMPYTTETDVVAYPKLTLADLAEIEYKMTRYKVTGQRFTDLENPTLLDKIAFINIILSDTTDNLVDQYTNLTTGSDFSEDTVEKEKSNLRMLAAQAFINSVTESYSYQIAADNAVKRQQELLNGAMQYEKAKDSASQ
ncbi:hypothetical protein [Vibrio parahaemolyticus]|uniref:hypothetical protein n=1 Tax=Vibrio parahaemolyticus TaxID=670 RepID=UPI003D7CCE7E